MNGEYFRKKNKRIYKGRFAERVRLYAWIGPMIMDLLNLLSRKLFPRRKKSLSLTIQKLIIDAALKYNIIDEGSDLLKKIKKIKELINSEISKQLNPVIKCILIVYL